MFSGAVIAMSEGWVGWIGAIAGGLAVLIAAGSSAWLLLRKGVSEINKADRNGVIEGWEGITAALQKRSDAQEEDIKSLHIEITKLYGELSALRTQVVARETELSALRTQITIRETERLQQRGTIHDLEKSVAAIQKPDTQAIAEALAPKLADAIATQVAVAQLPLTANTQPIPVQVVPDIDAPLPVEVKVVLPKGIPAKLDGLDKEKNK